MVVNDIHLDLKGYKGESKDAKYTNTIQVENFSFGVRSPYDVATGLSAGKRHWDTLTIVKRTDSATPLLIKALTENALVSKGTLTARKAGGGQQDYFTVDLENVRVVSFSISSPDSELPKETVQLSFSKITVTYQEQTPSGPTGGPITTVDDLTSQK
ncbi:MAG TPA: type VI secretion system tube protein Hcp [Thermoanaerobaculia bacterium]|nr:type VI secretion system tube protein Hcp [Thermoanaerobaculia bacterium]